MYFLLSFLPAFYHRGVGRAHGKVHVGKVLCLLCRVNVFLLWLFQSHPEVLLGKGCWTCTVAASPVSSGMGFRAVAGQLFSWQCWWIRHWRWSPSLSSTCRSFRGGGGVLPWRGLALFSLRTSGSWFLTSTWLASSGLVWWVVMSWCGAVGLESLSLLGLAMVLVVFNSLCLLARDGPDPA